MKDETSGKSVLKAEIQISWMMNVPKIQTKPKCFISKSGTTLEGQIPVWNLSFGSQLIKMTDRMRLL